MFLLERCYLHAKKDGFETWLKRADEFPQKAETAFLSTWTFSNYTTCVAWRGNAAAVP